MSGEHVTAASGPFLVTTWKRDEDAIEVAQVAIGVAGREEIIAYGRHESRLDAIALGLAQARAVIAACVKIDQSDARSPCCSAAIRCGRCGHDLAYVGAAS